MGWCFSIQALSQLVETICLSYKADYNAGQGAFAAAIEVSRRVSFSAISLEKTRAIFGRQIDISEEKPEAHLEGFEYYDEVMLSSANTFRGLENLITALNAINDWTFTAEQLKE